MRQCVHVAFVFELVNKPLQIDYLMRIYHSSAVIEKTQTDTKMKLPPATRKEGKCLVLQASKIQLKRWRLEEVLLRPSLVGLVPVIEHCCSNNETKDEIENEKPACPRPCQGSSKTPMRAKPGNPPPRVRRRVEGGKHSLRPHKTGLPISFYDESWLSLLSTHKLQELETSIQGGLLHLYLQMIENIPH
ncbi:hypothetical protein VP01_6252g2 [Puccinia sorghi]|uniref:Uncharacterized protein n=1 Tax=Puccinia sorghi TaxID=27349 RepID=A0A0L6UHA2_9BASI|nr:hypothetical protein VP01_6252g2 [Puccinia sorghi]